MNLIPTITSIASKKLVGKRIKMSLANDKTGDLWESFMPYRHDINRSSNDLISLQDYGKVVSSGDFNQAFDKWALAEVEDFKAIPDGMETMLLTGGLYAIFNYKGLPTDPSVFIYIFREWLPKSEYELDNRPHFEVLGEKYKNGDPNSEEDIYVPIKLKC